MGDPRLRRLAGLTCAATLALITVGGLVTSTDAGMAFKDWPTSAGRNLFTYPWFHDMLVGAWKQVFEHGHRLGGATVGLLTLALAFSLCLREPRRWVKWLGLLAAALVLLQGYLGGYRVRHDTRTLACLHACLAQGFFMLTVCLWTALSPSWDPPGAPRRDEGTRLLCLMGVVLVYGQIVLGAAVRQLHLRVLHHGLAAGLVLLVLGAACLKVLKDHAEVPALARPATWTAALAVFQASLGLASYLSLRAVPYPRADLGSVLHTTLHVATGAALLGSSAVLALRARRWLV